MRKSMILVFGFCVGNVSLQSQVNASVYVEELSIEDVRTDTPTAYVKGEELNNPQPDPSTRSLTQFVNLPLEEDKLSPSPKPIEKKSSDDIWADWSWEESSESELGDGVNIYADDRP